MSFSQDICALDADAQATFVATTLQTIQQVSNCYPVDGCEPQLLMFVEFVGVVSDGCNRVGLVAAWIRADRDLHLRIC